MNHVHIHDNLVINKEHIVSYEFWEIPTGQEDKPYRWIFFISFVNGTKEHYEVASKDTYLRILTELN